MIEHDESGHEAIVLDDVDDEGHPANVRNVRCLPDDDGPEVGLKIAGEEQRWFPVEIVDADGGDQA